MSEKLIVVHEGTKLYFVNKKLHREDGPAVIHRDGTQEYWLNGKRHRIAGPAICNYENGLFIFIKNGKVNPVNTTMEGKRYVVDSKTITDAVFRIRNILEEIQDVESYHMETSETRVNYYYKGMLHRCYCNRCACSYVHGDGPAEITANGSEIWYMYGVKHRYDGPAVYDVMTNQTIWYEFGMVHRNDGPAVVNYSDDKRFCNNYWYKYGVIENDKDSPAYIKFNIMSREVVARYYYKQGLLHREQGPAMVVIQDDMECRWWYQDGKFHNLRGPSYEGEITCWAINGTMYDEHTFNKIVKNVYKFFYKMRGPYRQRVSQVMYNNTTLCEDVCKLVSNYML